MSDAGGDPTDRFHAMQFHQMTFIGSQRALGMMMLVLLVQPGDVVGDGAREIALGAAPGARLADVFVTDHADDPAFDVDRRIEHRGNAERLQIRLAQFLSEPGILSVCGGKCAAIHDRSKILGEILRSQHRTLEDLTARALI